MSDDNPTLVAKCKILYMDLVDPTSKYNLDRVAYLREAGVDLTRGFVMTTDPITGALTIFQRKEE